MSMNCTLNFLEISSSDYGNIFKYFITPSIDSNIWLTECDRHTTERVDFEADVDNVERDVGRDVDRDSNRSTLSPNDVDSDSEFLASIPESEKERLHLKTLLDIPNPNSGLPPISFTSEESLRVEELLRIDRQAKIAFGDTLRERNRVRIDWK